MSRCCSGLLVVLAFGVRPALRRAGTALAVREPAENRQAGSCRHRLQHPPALNPPEPAPMDPERHAHQEIFEQVTGT